MSRIKRNGLGILTVLLCFAILLGCAKTAGVSQKAAGTGEKKNDEVIVTVGKDAITVSDYEEEMAMLPPVYRGMAMANKQQFLDSLINKHLLSAEAKSRHLENNNNVKKLVAKAQDEIMMQELIGIEITDKIKITDSDIEKYYEANKDKYIEPAKTRASHILVDSEVVAQKVLADLKGGADFAAVCKEYSLDAPTKDKGGDTGYFAKGTLLPEFEEACDKLQVGETSGVVKTALGYHVIKVTERKGPEPRPVSEVKNEIENELFVEKQISLYDDLMKKLKEGKEIKVNNAVFDKMGAAAQ